MADRYPLIANSDTKRIEELASGDNLNLSGNSVSGITTITADEFIGNLKGVSNSSKELISASNILSGTISSQRLSGHYPISVNYANSVDADNLINGIVPRGVLSGEYDIDITGTAQTSNYLQNAANINEGIISADRLTGVYDISITGSSYNTEITSGIAIGKTDNNFDYYLNFSTPNIFDDGTVSDVSLIYKDENEKLVYNPGLNRLGIGTSSPEYNVDVVGTVNATSYFGAGANIIGIVTQITSGIGIDISSTQNSGKGSVTITSYKPIGKTIYVSQNGNDSNTGLAENHPKRTIKNAVGIASSGDTIKVFPGVYVEDNPVVLGKAVSVEGTELRNCMITPQNPGLDLFHVNNGCHITDLSFVGPASIDGASIITFQPLAGVSSNRFFDGARMIRMNLDFIAAEAVGYITSTDYRSPAFVIPNPGNPNECKDDIKSILKCVIHDITRGGNSKCVGAGKSYYNNSGQLQHIVGVTTETIDALEYAVGIAHSCINNVSFVNLSGGNYQNAYTQIKDLSIQPDGDTNYDIGNCANVLSAVASCVGIVTTIIKTGLSAIGGAGINTTYPADYNGQTGNNWSSTKIRGTIYSPGVGNITQGPYVRNCTNFIPNSIGMKVDGFDAEPGDLDDIGVTGSMSVDSYTQYNQGGIGVSITNGAYAQLVSIFTICDDIAIFTGSGGQCDLTNSNSSFGRLGLVASGVGNDSTRSIYRHTGVVNKDVQRRNNIIEVSEIGNLRPYDGQVCYFGDLYYSVDTISIVDGGSGYIAPPRVTIESPQGPNGITVQANTTIENGKVVSVNILNSGTQYKTPPIVTIAGPTGVGSTATAIVTKLQPIYYKVDSATLPESGISTISLLQNLNNDVSSGTTVYFSRVSLQIASSHSFEWVGSGNDINKAKPALGGVTITDNEVVQENGGVVVYTSTDQSGNFNIGDGVIINQSTGAITGRDFTKSLFTTMTPFILALSD